MRVSRIWALSLFLVSVGSLCAAGSHTLLDNSPSPLPTNDLLTSKDIPWLWDRVWKVPPSQGVSLLMENIELRGSTMTARGRPTSPTIATSTKVTPLIHVEVNVFEPPKSPEQFNDKILGIVLRTAERSTSGWVQLDYEARPSGKGAYKELVRRIHEKLPPNVRLSVTALAWWCRSDAWLNDLAADEVVPMFFRMGKDAATMREVLLNDPDKLHPKCRNAAIGVSRQEPEILPASERYQKRYWFDNTAWKTDF